VGTAATTSTNSAQAQVVLLGEPRLVLAGGAAHALERKDAALLALLVVDGSTPRARAAALLWPDVDAESARNNLRQRLHRLRRKAGLDLVLTANDVLRLADGVAHDLAALSQRFSEEAAAASGDLLGNESYDDCEDLAEWIAVAREQWRNARRNALAEIASRLETDGHIALALQYAERLVAADPLLEHAHRRLMRLHYLRGDRAAALAAFERCKDVLRRNLRAAPAKETLDLAALVQASGALPQPVHAPKPVAVLRPPRLVGRDTEWRQLEIAWQLGRIALLIGEPGIGKTRLMTDFAAARDGVLATGSRPGDARVPYALLARLLRTAHQRFAATLEAWALAEFARLLPELGAAPAEKLETVRLQRAIAHAFGAWHGAGLSALFVDDLHFADDASLEALLALVDAGSEPTLRCVLGVRGAEKPTQLTEWHAKVDPDALVEVSLGPLDVPGIEALLVSLALPEIDAKAWAEPLARHTGGNPMFILETLSSVLAAGAVQRSGAAVRLPAPGNVGQLIERRLTLLSAAALRLARTAAIAGQDFNADLAAHVLKTHPLDLSEAWRELENAQVMRENAFAHDLIFEATVKGVPAPIAQLLHRDIAAYLEQHDGAAPRVAQHWFAAGSWLEAARQFEAAARASTAASRYAESGAMFERAAVCYDAGGDRTRWHEAMQELVACQLKAFDLLGARAVCERLRDATDNDDTRKGWALDRLADAANLSRDDAEAEVAAREMLALGEQTRNAWMIFNATRKLACALGNRGRTDEALALFDTQAGWIARNRHEWNVHVWFCDRAAVLELADRRAEAVAAYRDVIDLAQGHGNLYVVYAAQRNLALVAYWSGRLAEAVSLWDTAARFSERLGDSVVQNNPRDALRRAPLLRDAGRHAEALDLLHVTRNALRHGGSPFWLAFCGDQLALSFAELGQQSRCQRLLVDIPTAAPIEARVARNIVRAQITATEPSGASYAIQASADAGSAECPVRWRLLASLAVATSSERPDAAVALCARAIEHAQHRQLNGIRLHALCVAAAKAAEANDLARASAWAADALDMSRTIFPTGMGASCFYWTLYRSFDACGLQAQAETALREGLHFVNEIALPNVPDEFKDSFLNRNPANRGIRTTATRRCHT